MNQKDYSKLRISCHDGVVTVAIDNPPSTFSTLVTAQIRAFLTSIRDVAGTRVIIFESADPEFFMPTWK